MTNLKRGALALIAIASLVLAGCGAAAPGAGDPAGTVTSAFNAAETSGLTSLTQYACAAQADDLTSMFGADASGLSELEAAGIDADDLFDAMKIDFENLQATETSKSGSSATVHVTGTAKFSVDQEKFKVIMKQVMEAQGLPTDDATVDGAIAMMSGALSQTQEIDEDVALVQENGKWLIC
jgi:hypothetical protein